VIFIACLIGGLVLVMLYYASFAVLLLLLCVDFMCVECDILLLYCTMSLYLWGKKRQKPHNRPGVSCGYPAGNQE